MPREFCNTFWAGGHGCFLDPGHDGDHLCLFLVYEHPWVWMDTGGWCNWWEGKELGFFHGVCSRYGNSSPSQAM